MRKFLFGLYSVIFAAIVVGAATLFWQTRIEYKRLKDVELATRERVKEAQGELELQQEVLRRLREDPAYVETVIRRRLGYAKPDEMLFRFDSEEIRTN